MSPVIEQELEAPAVVLGLLHAAALELGASPEQAAEVARTGVVELESRGIAVAFSADERSLVLTTPLAAGWFDEPANQRLALRASVGLMCQAGVAFCRLLAGPALICRWAIEQGEARLLAGWIRQFALMANVLANPVPASMVGETEAA